jgi:uncharacterized protein YcfL
VAAVPATAILASAFVAAALTACGSVNTTYTRTTPSATAVPTNTQVNDALTQIFLRAGEVRMFPSKGGPLEVQVDVINNGFSYRGFSYRFDWVDANGSVIPSQVSVWKTSNVPSGGSTTIRAIAPSESATDFRLQVRRADE